MPIAELIAEVNRYLKGWGGYFRHGYPRASFDKLNGFVVERLRTSSATSQSTPLPGPRRTGRSMPTWCKTSVCACCERLSLYSLCMPKAERIRVSRMREIRAPRNAVLNP